MKFKDAALTASNWGMPSASGVQRCKVCGADALEDIPEFRSLPRVTSDCLPFRDGGRLLVCRECSAAQSPADEQWFGEIGEIYDSYSAYRQAGGEEQCVLDPATGRVTQRSRVLVSKLLALAGCPQSGTVLDIGCGTGGTLKAFSDLSGWRLFGSELDNRSLPVLRAIDGFETLYTCPLPDLPGRFTLITMVHALEHFSEPVSTLRDLHSKIAAGGRLFVEAPNAEANPFDYLIADHMIHFTPTTLSFAAARAGFAIDCLALNWVTKELSLTAHPSGALDAASLGTATEIVDQIRARIVWLSRFVEAARQASAGGRAFGLFGSSVAATWLCGVLGDRVSFLVEEDTNRIGRTHLDRPIVSPAQAPPGSVVFLAMAPQIARLVAERHRNTPFELRSPPDLV